MWNQKCKYRILFVFLKGDCFSQGELRIDSNSTFNFTCPLNSGWVSLFLFCPFVFNSTPGSASFSLVTTLLTATFGAELSPYILPCCPHLDLRYYHPIYLHYDPSKGWDSCLYFLLANRLIPVNSTDIFSTTKHSNMKQINTLNNKTIPRVEKETLNLHWKITLDAIALLYDHIVQVLCPPLTLGSLRTVSLGIQKLTVLDLNIYS